jgi:hypothetical protein
MTCDACSNCIPEMLMGGVGLFVYMSDPRTLGSLADRNAKFRIPQVAEEKEKKREQDKKEGKFVPKQDVTTWWDKPEGPKVDMQERKKVKKEHVAKYNARKRTTRNNNDGGSKGKRA